MPYVTSECYIRYRPHELLLGMCKQREDEILDAASVGVIEDGRHGIGLKYEASGTVKRFAVLADSADELQRCREVLAAELHRRLEKCR